MEDVKDVKMLLDNLEDSENQNQTQTNNLGSCSTNNFSNFKQGSLVALTQKFLQLVHQGNGVVDLNHVSRNRVYCGKVFLQISHHSTER